MALACSAGSGNIVTTMPSTTADAAAPPAPWANRAPISSAGLSARPHSSDASVKNAKPATNTFLRPARSPSRPNSSSMPPKVIR